MEKDIELRSEEVQEILTRPPHALVRWGVTVFFGVLVVVFIGGCFFKYPDVISASVTVTTEHPPIWIVARGSGKIKEVYRHDRDSVGAGDAIAVLDNPASTRDVLLLKELLGQFSLYEFFGSVMSVVVGLEFIKMLVLHTPKAVTDVLLFAIARQLVVSHSSAMETLLGVAAVALIFVVKKFLLDQEASSSPADHLSNLQGNPKHHQTDKDTRS